MSEKCPSICRWAGKDQSRKHEDYLKRQSSQGGLSPKSSAHEQADGLRFWAPGSRTGLGLPHPESQLLPTIPTPAGSEAHSSVPAEGPGKGAHGRALNRRTR